ncbi:hypothetical protein AB0D04_40625 [Streptomyces sp. NPDC048483]|uniref:hypothetical protein n=1 Tax=Streptomyces sp. NPDC048483 TaxID=3154927 RepID=UPI0034180D89
MAGGTEDVTDGVMDGPAAEVTGGVLGETDDAVLGASFRGVVEGILPPEVG